MTEDNANANADVRPRPDPTELTTEQSDRLRRDMLREDAHLKALLEQALAAAVSLIDERFKVIESQRVEAKVDTKEALDKAEGAVDKLDEATRRDIEEIKERLGKIEQRYVTRESFDSRLSGIELGSFRPPG